MNSFSRETAEIEIKTKFNLVASLLGKDNATDNVKNKYI